MGEQSDAAALAAATEYELPSGRKILWLAPDDLTMLAFTGNLPDTITAAVYLLLEQEGAIKVDADDPASYHRKRNELLAQYQIIKMGMVKPKFDPDLEIGDDLVWGRRNLSKRDREHIYQWCFQLATTPEALAVSNRDELGRLAQLISDSQGVRPDTSAADGGDRPVPSLLSEPSGAPSGGESEAEG